MVARSSLIVVLSIGGGVLVGSVAAGTISPIALPFGATFGAVVGLAVSPVLIAALVRRSLVLAACMILPPALVTAIVAGMSGNPAVTLVSVVVFLGMAGVANQVLPSLPLRIPQGCCRACRYELGDLPCCPECGTPSGYEDPGPPRSRRLACAVALSLAAVMLPMVVAGLAAYERHRPRTTAEWIERLGHNDMQIQWEARSALRPLGRGPLVEAIQHPKAGVRRNAARALGELRDPLARDVLVAALTDPDVYVQREAERALEALATP